MANDCKPDIRDDFRDRLPQQVLKELLINRTFDEIATSNSEAIPSVDILSEVELEFHIFEPRVLFLSNT